MILHRRKLQKINTRMFILYTVFKTYFKLSLFFNAGVVCLFSMGWRATSVSLCSDEILLSIECN